MSEINTPAHPACADTIPTSAGREDRAGMRMAAALDAARAENPARGVTAVEILCTCRALGATIASGAVEHACGKEVKQKLGIDNVRVRS